MPWLAYIPYLFLGGCTFLFGLMVGSFLNVLIARLPYQKSIIWPGSRCFVCYRPIRLLDNVPILGYLRLRGRCRACGAGFSARYLWVEVGTGVAFVALFALEVLTQMTSGPDFVRPWQFAPGLHFNFYNPGPALFQGIIYWAAHAFLLAMLIASAVIDAKHRIIPTQITYVGTLIGLGVSTLFPWPWPSGDPQFTPSNWLALKPAIPNGIALWPFWVPLGWAPPGSPLLGFLNGLIGAAVGMLIGRAIKGLFEFGKRQDSLGLGDADLLMMAGSFLGWQPISLALPVGSVITLAAIPFVYVGMRLFGRRFDVRVLPFGPGIAAGVVACWLGWPWLGELVRPALFDPTMIGIVGGLFGGGLLIAGFLFRQRGEPEPAGKVG